MCAAWAPQVIIGYIAYKKAVLFELVIGLWLNIFKKMSCTGHPDMYLDTCERLVFVGAGFGSTL